jgi:hypothetical protein
MIKVRQPEEIYQASGQIENGSFRGRWHFSFDQYDDPEYRRFGPLRVFNDDTLSPGAIWPLHPHNNIEVVTYCAEGEFRHADENGKGGVLEKGWVQHTSVGRGMWHSEINNRPDAPMRFIQMWFLPNQSDIEPAVRQRKVDKSTRRGHLLALVSNKHVSSLPIAADVEVFSSFLEIGKSVEHALAPRRGAYLYVVEGGPVDVNGYHLPALAAAKITDERVVSIQADGDAEFLLVDVPLES